MWILEAIKQIWRKTQKNFLTKSGVDLDQFAVIMSGTWSKFILIYFEETVNNDQI